MTDYDDHPISDLDTVDAARRYVMRSAMTKDGATCPCCQRLVRTYRYRVSRTQALFLIALARASQAQGTGLQGCVDLRQVGGRFGAGVQLGGKYAKLRFWGLIARDPDHAATWRLTPRGVAYLRGQPIPAYVYLLDNRHVGNSDTYSTISEALQTAFDLDDALQSPAGLPGRA